MDDKQPGVPSSGAQANKRICSCDLHFNAAMPVYFSLPILIRFSPLAQLLDHVSIQIVTELIFPFSLSLSPLLFSPINSLLPFVVRRWHKWDEYTRISIVVGGVNGSVRNANLGPLKAKLYYQSSSQTVANNGAFRSRMDAKVSVIYEWNGIPPRK